MLFTIGYEGLSLAGFFELLCEHEIQTLADVRVTPLSRKPGFSKGALMQQCERSEINYRHFSALGCPRPILTDYRNDGNWEEYSRRFWAYLRSEEEALESALENVGRLTLTSRVALLCFEADFRFCHRSYVAEEISRRLDGWNVCHITNRGITEDYLATSAGKSTR